jgi:hypothetical protein
MQKHLREQHLGAPPAGLASLTPVGVTAPCHRGEKPRIIHIHRRHSRVPSNRPTTDIQQIKMHREDP